MSHLKPSPGIQTATRTRAEQGWHYLIQVLEDEDASTADRVAAAAALNASGDLESLGGHLERIANYVEDLVDVDVDYSKAVTRDPDGTVRIVDVPCEARR